MNDYVPKAGDRVRVVLEGVVLDDFRPNPEWVNVKGENWRTSLPLLVPDTNVKVERLPDPEPQLIVRDGKPVQP